MKNGLKAYHACARRNNCVGIGKRERRGRAAMTIQALARGRAARKKAKTMRRDSLSALREAEQRRLSEAGVDAPRRTGRARKQVVRYS